MHLVCYCASCYSCLCTFWPYHPYLVMHLIGFYTCLCYFFWIVYGWKPGYGKWAAAEWLRGVVTKLSHPCDCQQRHEAFGNHNTIQDYKINCKAIAGYLNIICIHWEKRERECYHWLPWSSASSQLGCGRGAIVCSACSSEHAHMATKQRCTMNLGTCSNRMYRKWLVTIPRRSYDIIDRVLHCVI